MSTTLAEIVSKIASQGKNPDVSFLKDNPEAQTMLLMALLSANNNNKNTSPTSPTAPAVTVDSASKTDANDKRKYDSFNSPNNTPSPSREDDSEAPRRVGRKPVTSEEEDSDNPKSKRKAQNRAAQRAFRERKENHVRILEDRVKELEDLNSDKSSALLLENEQLKDMITRLQNENAALLGSSVSFDYPLSSSADERPQKIIRSSAGNSTLLSDASPVAYFDTLGGSSSSNYSTTTTSSKSRSNTPETHISQQPMSIDDILGLDTSILPSNALLDHSELLGFNNGQKTTDYSSQLDDILNQHRLTFATDPSQFDFFYPLEVQTNLDATTTPITTQAPTQATQQKQDNEILSLTKVWDKVSQHERFDEFDMDVLCDEMKKKAVCNDFDHDKELEKVVNQYYPVE